MSATRRGTAGKGTAGKTTGERAEQHAQAWLHEQGLITLTRNYRCRLGEVDLVMLDGPTLVFVEVRWRRHQQYGGPLASVDQRKQRRLTQAARHFLGRHPEQAQRPCRFDVLGLAPATEGAESEVHHEWIQNAFYASYG